MTATTVAEVIDALGGNRAIAQLTGVGASAVSNWRTWGKFPQRLHYRIFRECERRGVVLDPSLFEDDMQAPTVAQPEHPAGKPLNRNSGSGARKGSMALAGSKPSSRRSA